MCTILIFNITPASGHFCSAIVIFAVLRRTRVISISVVNGIDLLFSGVNQCAALHMLPEIFNKNVISLPLIEHLNHKIRRKQLSRARIWEDDEDSDIFPEDLPRSINIDAAGVVDEDGAVKAPGDARDERAVAQALERAVEKAGKRRDVLVIPECVWEVQRDKVDLQVVGRRDDLREIAEGAIARAREQPTGEDDVLRRVLEADVAPDGGVEQREEAVVVPDELPLHQLQLHTESVSQREQQLQEKHRLRGENGCGSCDFHFAT